MINCCYKCNDRHVDVEAGTRCHSTCEKYKAQSLKHNAKRAIESRGRHEEHLAHAPYSATKAKKSRW